MTTRILSFTYALAFLALVLGLSVPSVVYAQDYFSPQITSNRNPSGWEHNMLFNAKERFSVTQTGPTAFNLNMMFDGRGNPSYPADGLDPSAPTVITISGFGQHYRQGGIWVGWSARFWPPKRFKIEMYDIKGGYNDWRVIADYSSTDYTGGGQFAASVGYNGIYTKVRYTFYESADGNVGANGFRRVGLSELFYINTETGRPYQGLLPSSMWEVDGNVGIGVRNPGADRLAVDGTIRSKEVIVTDSGWADYVFTDDYTPMPLSDLRAFIDANRHLPGIPTTEDIERDGAALGQTQVQLLAKIEELTLYTLDQQAKIDSLQAQMERQRVLINELLESRTASETSER